MRVERNGGLNIRRPAEKSRVHLERLLAFASISAIARETHLSRGTLQRVLSGAHRTVLASTEDAILAIPLKPSTGGAVRPVEARRQVRALYSIGWPVAELMKASGASDAFFYGLLRGTTGWINAENAAMIRDLYRKLENTPGPSAMARRRGKENGWPLPADWDGRDMTNPCLRVKRSR